jgi:hypothetical protein
MQFLPIEAIVTIADGEIVDGAMMQSRQHAGMVLGPHATDHAGAAAGSSEVSAAADTSGMDLAAHAANVSAATGEATETHVAADAATVDAANARSCADAADMACFCHPTEMPASANAPHVAATTAAATRLGRSREQTRGKQRRGQNRCYSHRHDTSSPCIRRDPGAAAPPVSMER